MIIGACGFGSTGSSALSDYLLEFENTQVLDQIEFTWAWIPDGLIDLEYHLNHPHGRTSDSITAIKRYQERVIEATRDFKRFGKIDPVGFKKSADSFLDSITTLKWNWWFLNDKLFNRFVGRYLMVNRLIPYFEKKKGHQVKCYPMEEIKFSVRPENFNEAAKKHIREILELMGADFSKHIILDQPFSGDNPQACFPYFDDPYAIVVDRDPRDNYVFAKTKLLGRNHFMAVDPVEDFCKYYRALRDNQPYKENNERILRVQFEAMVYEYEKTTALIREFLHLPENPRPKSIFDPAISMPNTQVWKRYPQYEKDIEYIERELPEYLFDFSPYPEPSKDGVMFFGKSPKNK